MSADEKHPGFLEHPDDRAPAANRRPRFDAMLGLLCNTNHPALAEFPTDKNCDWQWTQLINGVRSVNLTATPRELLPIVWAIDDWNRNWKLGVIFECNVGPGRLLFPPSTSTMNSAVPNCDNCVARCWITWVGKNSGLPRRSRRSRSAACGRGVRRAQRTDARFRPGFE